MSNREIALQTLRGPVARRIDFSFISLDGVTVTVNQTTFERVAVAIERGGGTRGRVNLDFRSRMPQRGAGALYFPQEDRSLNPVVPANTLMVHPIRGPREQGALIHEAVHASIDLTYSDLRVVDNEAAAYIAIALYDRMIGIRHYRRRLQLRTDALAVADSVLRTGQVDTTALTNLRNSIASNDSYSYYGMTGRYISDG